MRAFKLKLVEQLVSQPGVLSRNRHFDTFDDASGRSALRTSRFLRALERDILAQHRRGNPVEHRREEREGDVVVRLEISHLRARRVAYLEPAEFEILLRQPGIREALGLDPR